MLDRLMLNVDVSLQPQSRRRAYSDSYKPAGLIRPMFRRLASPPPLVFAGSPLTTIEAKVPLETPISPLATDNHLFKPSPSFQESTSHSQRIDCPSVPMQSSYPIPPPESPSLSRYAGMVVGSPLGSGPLNGQHLTALDLSPTCSTDSIPGAAGSSPPLCDLPPIPRPRLPSVSETPSVAPIPENMPLPDSPRRPPLFASFSVDSSGAVTAAGVSKSQQQQQQQQKFKDSKRDDGWSSADEATMGPTPRQRSGTWSLANSRRRKERLEKEEEARVRQRRKSGDDLVRLAACDAAAAGVGVASSRRRAEGGPAFGFFESFRPRSKSDAKAILQARQRRRSGDDSLNSSTLPASSRDVPPSGKDRKKEASPGFLESFRPRSKSDAARLANKKTNIMASVRNAVQHTLVSPGGGRGGGGRRSGENTPPLDCRAPTQGGGGEEYHHYTWHAGGERSKTSSLFKVLDLFRGGGKDDDKKRRSAGKLGERGRRNSGDLQDRSRTNSGSLTSVYIRGMDPTTAANVFRDCRGLPEADPLIQYLSKEEESQILVKFFKLHHSYDLIPTSAKLVIFDTSLQVKKAFYALVRNGVRAAPLWDHARQKFVGMLTITDFIRILHSFHHTHDPQMEKLEDHRLYEWRTFLQDEDRPLISISPDESLYDAIRFLIHHKIHRLPVIDPATGNVLYIITHKRILKFLYLYIKEIPKPAVLQKTLGELGIGTYDNIETATADMLIIEALDKFVKHRISALPIVDAEGKLQDIYAKFDVINLAAEGTYHKLDVTLRQANEYRNEWFEGVLRCRRDEKLITVMDRIVHAEVHRLVVVDNDEKVIGIVSLSDILKELVLRPCDDESPTSAAAAALKTLSLVTASQIDAPLTKSGSEESCGEPENLTEGLVSPEGGKGSSGDSEDEGRYSMDKSEETPPAVTTPEVIPISG